MPLVQHTPGPWYVEKTKEGANVRTSAHLSITKKIGGVTRTSTYTGKAICYMAHNNKISPLQKVTDANLIAAAPELLKQLERALLINKYRVAVGDIETDAFTAWQDDSRAAIAKAKGELK